MASVDWMREVVGDEVSAGGKISIRESLDLFPKCHEKPLKCCCCVDCRREDRWHGD